MAVVLGIFVVVGAFIALSILSVALGNAQKRRVEIKKLEGDLARALVVLEKATYCPGTKVKHQMRDTKYEVRGTEKWSNRVVLANTHTNQNTQVVRRVEREKLIPMLRTYWSQYRQCNLCGLVTQEDGFTDKER